MPPRFEAAQPLAPSISAAAGGANAILSANDTLARAYQENARLAAARTEAARERSFRAGQAAQDRGLQAQALSAQAMGRLAGVNAEAQQREFQRVADQTNLASQLQNQAERDQFVHQARLAEQRDAFQLRDWLAQRAITHQETARYQQQQQAVAEVLQSQELTPEEKKYALKRLKFGIDEYEQRQKAAQAKMAESHAALYQSQAEMQKRVELQNQEFERRMTEQGQGVLRWTDPNTGKTHPLLKNPRTGEWYNPMLSSGKSAEAKPFDTQRAVKDAKAEALLAFPDDVVDPATGKSRPSQEQLRRRQEYETQMFEKQRDRHAAAQQQPAGPGQPQQVPAPTPASEPLAEAKPFDPSDLSGASGAQKSMVAAFDGKRVEWEGRADLPPEVRQHGSMVLEAAKQLLAAHGSYQRMPGPVRELYDKYQAEYRRLRDQFPPPAPTPAPARPRTLADLPEANPRFNPLGGF